MPVTVLCRHGGLDSLPNQSPFLVFVPLNRSLGVRGLLRHIEFTLVNASRSVGANFSDIAKMTMITALLVPSQAASI